jgi:hypothetical protein
MATINENVARAIAAGEYASDQPVKVVTYNNDFSGELAWAVVFKGEDYLRYETSPYCHNVQTFWAEGYGVNPGWARTERDVTMRGNEAMEQGLTIWTIYDHPSDFPNHFVAREWWVAGAIPLATGMVLRCAELGPLREQMRARGLSCLMRNECDDTVIVESWL